MPKVIIEFESEREARCYLNAPNMAAAIHHFRERLRRLNKDFDGPTSEWELIERIYLMFCSDTEHLVEWE